MSRAPPKHEYAWRKPGTKETLSPVLRTRAPVTEKRLRALAPPPVPCSKGQRSTQRAEKAPRLVLPCTLAGEERANRQGSLSHRFLSEKGEHASNTSAFLEGSSSYFSLCACVCVFAWKFRQDALQRLPPGTERNARVRGNELGRRQPHSGAGPHSCYFRVFGNDY